MNNDLLQIVALCCLAYFELCTIRGNNPALAYMWDTIATLCGWIANFLGRISVQARLNYFEAVQA